MDSVHNTKLSVEKVTFQRRTEQLDWRKIASIDIDNLIQEGDTSQLLELIRPVTFCKADNEFDGGGIRIDPAFIKVFRISQLISEFLMASQESSIERLNSLQEKYTAVEHEKEKLLDKILHLKETLTSAKKELKKRTETLASTQSEMLGENNRDEFDQCPYCTKRFLSPQLLLAHLQRRHQGLPMNPLFPSGNLGSGTSVACQHSFPQSLHGTQMLRQLPIQQGVCPASMYDSQLSLVQSSHQAPAVMNPHQHQMFPSSIPTPSPSILHGNNLQQLQSNMSFSGSITSLNNLPLNPPLGTSTQTFPGTVKRESFTQTAIPPNEHYDLKSLSRLDLLQKEVSSVPNQQRQEHDESHDLSNDKLSPDSLNPILNGLAGKDETVDGSHHPVDDNAHREDDAGNTSALSNGEWIESIIKRDVCRLPQQTNAQWANLDSVKGTASGGNNTTISRPDETAQFYGKHSSKELGGNVELPGEKYSADGGQVESTPVDGEKKREYEELQRILKASVQGELKSLISRLESQEQLWQNKLALLEQDHERQIQQLRQELQRQTGKRNSNGLVLDGNEVVPGKDKFEPEREIRGTEERGGAGRAANEDSGNVPAPSGIILVEPKSGQHPTSGHDEHRVEAETGVTRESLGDPDEQVNGESRKIPVAKPRKSKVEGIGRTTHFHFDPTQTMSSVIVNANQEHKERPVTQQKRPPSAQSHPEYYSHEGTQQQQHRSFSESDSEVVAIILVDEFHEGKHDNSILANSSCGTAPKGGTALVTRNAPEFPYQKQHSTLENSQLVPGRKIAGEEIRGTTQANSDKVSDYTLSESVDGGDDEAREENNDMCTWSPHNNDRRYHNKESHHLESADQPRGKTSLNQMRGKKKYVLDRQSRKLIEVSPGVDSQDEDDYERSEHCGANGDLNNTSSADEFTSGGRNRRSQVDLVRAKTEMELDQSMSDIGLNPESTAIGMEELKRALKHFKTQQLPDHKNMDDYESHVKERNAVKAHARFEATKSSIDEKLDALSTLSSKKSGRNSLVKILSAVKSSGKNFKKRVASAVKKKEKAHSASGDEKRKRKPASDSASKKSFFSWTKHKNSEGKGTPGDGPTGEQELESSREESSSEESDDEELEVETVLQPSKNRSRPVHRTSSQSSEEITSGDPKRLMSQNSRRKKATGKALKRLNSSVTVTNRKSLFQRRKSENDERNSTESSPFSNVEDYDKEYEEMRNKYRAEDESCKKENEREAISGNKTQTFSDEKRKECRNSTNLSEKRLGKRKDNDISTVNDEDYRDDRSVISAGMTESEDDEEESLSCGSGDGDSDAVSFATSKEILANVKSSGLVSVETSNKARNEEEEGCTDNKHSELARPSYISSGKCSSLAKGRLNEISDSRLKQIKSLVSKRKEEVTRDEILLSEEDFCEDDIYTSSHLGEEDGNGIKHPKYDESKQNYQRERKLAFTENNRDGHTPRPVPGSHSSIQQKWATTELINFAGSETNVQKDLKRNATSSNFRNNQEASKAESALKLGPDVFPRKLFQFSEHEDESEWSIDTHKLQDANMISTPAQFKPRGNEQEPSTRFLTSTPVRGKLVQTGMGRPETIPQWSRGDSDEDLEDLLKSENSDGENTSKRAHETMPKSPTKLSRLPVYTRKPANIPLIQPTNHNNSLSGLRSKAEEQSRILQQTGRPVSGNSWDSQR